MSQLAKALLLELKAPGDPGTPKRVNVQFNPHTLRLQYASHSEGGTQPARQARQYTGTGSTTLTVDLVFDTADEGSTDAPVPVLSRTANLQYFITPQKVHGSNDAPPRLSFQWGTLQLDGVMETLAVDLEHFAADGTALRAKASLTLKGQDAELQNNRKGTGSNTAVGSTPSAAANAGAAAPGGLSLGLSLGASIGVGVGIGVGFSASASLSLGASASLGIAGSVTQALAGESLAQMAARNGLAPEAWRSLSAGVSNPLSLPAGQEVALPAPADTALGAGASQGVQAGSDPTPAQSLGLAPGAGGSALTGALQRGYALAGAGGLGAALATLKTDAASSSAAQARQDFASPAGTAATPAERNAIFSLRADPRADSFGRGVPLRDRVQIAHDERANLLSGQALVKGSQDSLPPTRSDPAVPAWVALPAGPATPLRHQRGCGCGCAA
jgi:hypothetical protein